jgi:hypothetical protein
LVGKKRDKKFHATFGIAGGFRGRIKWGRGERVSGLQSGIVQGSRLPSLVDVGLIYTRVIAQIT